VFEKVKASTLAGNGSGSNWSTPTGELIGPNLKLAAGRTTTWPGCAQGLQAICTPFGSSTKAYRTDPIERGSILEGKTKVGTGTRIGPYSILRDTTVGANCRVEASVLEGATLEDEVTIGPFSHLRPGSYLERGVGMGNFGEVKASRLGAGTKMHHFSYVGDASVGKRVNIGAGVITVNYDGVNKNRTDIGDDAFIGSDTLLRAPVKVGKNAATGAGAVVTKDVPDDMIGIGMPARVRTRTKPAKKG